MVQILLYTMDVNNYRSNTNPPLTFNIYVPLILPPYTVEIWDYDPVGGDDFGGSYTISSTNATWSVKGNNGSYIVNNNPALDVHWGIEKLLIFT